MAEKPKTAIVVTANVKSFKKLDFTIKKQSKKQRLQMKATLFKKFIVFIILYYKYPFSTNHFAIRFTVN